MCGIAGYYSIEKKFSEEDLKNMTTSLKHRGPDAYGYFTDEIAGLGNRRLKVIDLSEQANQPIYSDDNRFVIVYNGEVYNYKEVAAEIKAANSSVVFKTSSDTEVILKAFIQFGPGFVEKLNGMFAFAIYNRVTREMYVYRDRLGIKPLYYYWDEKNNFAFASELKALVKLKQIPLEINTDAVHEFLHLGYIPFPHSIYKGINKLQAGCYLKIAEREFQAPKPYWNFEYRLKDDAVSDESKATAQLEELLTSSVRYQMKSDVPYGIFLSGGIDSSLVTSIAVEQSGDKVNTFSIGFEEAEYNESEHAKKVASHLGTVHHEFIVSYKDALPLIDTMITIYDEPYADSSAIPAMLVSKMARQHVTVALSGEGGDELFFGYGTYKWANTLFNPFWKSLRKPVSSLLKLFPDARYQKASMLFDYPLRRTASHIASQDHLLFSDKEIDGLLASYKANGYIDDEIANRSKRRLQPAEYQAMFDLKYYMPDDLLTKMDRASMLYSLEARVPYLDHRIVEFALNLSPSLKVKNGTTKYLLKQLLYKRVPKEYLDRRKQGFSIPLKSWLQKELRYLVDEFLDKETIERFGIVKYETVREMKEDFFAGKTYLYNRLWLLIVLHKWMDEQDFNQ